MTTSCSKEESAPVNASAKVVEFRVLTEKTRAVPIEQASFKHFELYSNKENGTTFDAAINGVVLEKAHDKWYSLDPILWDEAGPAFVNYYGIAYSRSSTIPFTPSITSATSGVSNDGEIQILVNLGTATSDANQSDLVWAGKTVTSYASTVALDFFHLIAGVEFEVTNTSTTSGVTVLIHEIQLSNVDNDGTVVLPHAEAIATTASATPTWNGLTTQTTFTYLDSEEGILITSDGAGTDKWTGPLAFIAPQQITNGSATSATITYTVLNGTTVLTPKATQPFDIFVANSGAELTLLPNVKYKFTAEFKERSLINFSVNSVVGWPASTDIDLD
jgi:hypothetical protein